MRLPIILLILWHMTRMASCFMLRRTPTPHLTAFPVSSISRRLSKGNSRVFSSSVQDPESPKRVAIIGGGLAGLSTAFQLLQKSPEIDVTIFDKAAVGTSGASSVAGGFLHPLSPRGKLVHLGLEGLASTNGLLDQAMQHQEGVVLRKEIFRMALDENQASTLQKTANTLPDLSQWMEPNELDQFRQEDVLGALRLHSGCKVIHVPSYLKGLWSACCAFAPDRVRWTVEPSCTAASFDWKQKLADFDTVVFSAGSGLFSNLVPVEELPVTLVRGQSIELKIDGVSLDHAMLGGKYISPLPEKDRVLIGATHEFDNIPWDQARVKAELKERSYQFTSTLWDNGRIDRITSGVRVQSNRGRFGRMPIIGKYETETHDNAWIFTGLSSRGLLYHGVFGDLLTDMMMLTPTVSQEELALDWWNKK